MTEQEHDNTQENNSKPETINMLPTTPKGFSRMLIRPLQGYAKVDRDVSPTGEERLSVHIPYEHSEEVQDLVDPYGRCMVVVQELQERGELDDEKVAELIESYKERRESE